MAGQRGREVLIKLGNGSLPEAFAKVAGIRAKTIALGAGLIDATTTDSPDVWRELITGASVKTAEVSASGVFKGAASEDAAGRLTSPAWR